MDAIIELAIRYWWVILLAILALMGVLGHIFGDGSTPRDAEGPCEVTGSSGCS